MAENKKKSPINHEKLMLILKKHDDWLNNKNTGRRANLTGFNLRDVDLSNRTLSKIIFIKADLTGANLSESILYKVSFQNAILEGANLSKSQLEKVSFRSAIATGINLKGAVLKNALLLKAKFQGANFEGASLEGADVRYAIFEGANLAGINLNRVDLYKADPLLFEVHEYLRFFGKKQGYIPTPITPVSKMTRTENLETIEQFIKKNGVTKLPARKAGGATTNGSICAAGFGASLLGRVEQRSNYLKSKHGKKKMKAKKEASR